MLLAVPYRVKTSFCYYILLLKHLLWHYCLTYSDIIIQIEISKSGVIKEQISLN